MGDGLENRVIVLERGLGDFGLVKGLGDRGGGMGMVFGMGIFRER